MVPKLKHIPSVSEFYKGADILITGATGFIGLVLIEKLLRSCPDLNKIYAIVRPKRGKSVQERRKVFSESELYEYLLGENPNALDKLVLIEGDMSLAGLGLSDIDKKKLENVSVVFHSAASIRFDEPLKEAILGHIRATRDLLELASGFKKIKAFVHVSTAFCNMDNGSLEDMKMNRIEEKLYPDMDDWANVIKLAENLDKDTLNTLTIHFTKFSLNTYLYTKALGESVCKSYQEKLPIVIYRPSIVIAKASPPLMGWANNLNGPSGLSIAGYMGILRLAYGNIDNVMDGVFVDATANGMIVCACKRHLIDEETAVYNSNFMRGSVSDIVNIRSEIELKYPLSMSFWAANNGSSTCCIYNFKIQSILFHMIPAIVIDKFLELTGRAPILQKIQQKIQKTQIAVAYFTRNSFEIRNFKFLQLINYLNESDRKTFDTIMKETAKNYTKYTLECLHCARKYILKDPDETIPDAIKHYRRLQIADKVVWSIFYGGIIYKLYNYFLY